MLRMVALGDSLTCGFPFRPEDSWASIVADRTGFEIHNKGICGETTGEMRMRFIQGSGFICFGHRRKRIIKSNKNAQCLLKKDVARFMLCCVNIWKMFSDTEGIFACVAKYLLKYFRSKVLTHGIEFTGYQRL